MSEFGGLQIALSSLQTQQRALEIAANNVANAHTAGYSRQAANMTTVGGSTPAFFSTSTGDGQGVTISSVTRFRDAFMEIQAGLTAMTSRVADLSLSQNAIQQLQASLNGIADLQNQAATGKKLTKPSDSPVDIGQSLQLRSDLNRNAQLSNNISDAEGWLGTTDSTLGQMITQLQQVNTLVLQAANGSNDQVARDAIANQIEQIRQGLIGLANSQYGNRPLFGGTASGGVAYDASGSYVGTSASVQRTIAPGVQVQVNVNGDTAFGPPGNDVFSTLDQIANAVQGNQSLTALSAQLKTQTQAVQTAQATVGATYARVDATKTQNTTNASTMTQNLSNVENADMAEVLMNLQAQETTYQAALAAAAKAIQPSLAAFLQ